MLVVPVVFMPSSTQDHDHLPACTKQPLITQSDILVLCLQELHFIDNQCQSTFTTSDVILTEFLQSTCTFHPHEVIYMHTYNNSMYCPGLCTYMYVHMYICFTLYLCIRM